VCLVLRWPCEWTADAEREWREGGREHAIQGELEALQGLLKPLPNLKLMIVLLMDSVSCMLTVRVEGWEFWAYSRCSFVSFWIVMFLVGFWFCYVCFVFMKLMISAFFSHVQPFPRLTNAASPSRSLPRRNTFWSTTWQTQPTLTRGKQASFGCLLLLDIVCFCFLFFVCIPFHLISRIVLRSISIRRPFTSTNSKGTC
jgi:hypothetical protein